MKLTPEFPSLSSASSKTTAHPHIIDASSHAGARLVLPLDNALLDAEFTRTGRDLTVEAHGHRPVVITDYFSQEAAPALLSSTGKQIRGETVGVLTGNPAANQYAGPVEGAGPIGKVEKLAGDVFIKRANGDEMQLQEGDEVYQNDIVRTEGDGSIGITFVDGSVFTLGNDARMTLDSLVYDPATGEGSSSVTVIKGMFKFISGDIAANNPGDMVVETPVATIGIRGTTGGGHVIGPGADNQFFLEPNADGTVGWFDVTTDAGTVSMNQPYMNVGISDISTPPPPPSFTTPDALLPQLHSVNNVLPEGRYDSRPDSGNNNDSQQPQQQNDAQPDGTEGGEQQTSAEGEGEETSAEDTGEPQAAEQQSTEEQSASDEGQNTEGEAPTEGENPEASELLGQEGQLSGETPPQQTEGENANGEQQAAEQTAEGTNSDNLTEVEGANQELAQSGNENFDGQQNAGDGQHQQTQQRQENHDPTDNPVDQFVHKGTADQFVNNGNAASSGNSTGQHTAGTGNTQGTGVKTQGQTVAQNTVQNKPKSDGTNDFFQTVQEQIRLGNLPPDALTNPALRDAVRDALSGNGNPGTGTNTPPPPGTNPNPGTNPSTPPPTDGSTTPPPTGTGGGGNTGGDGTASGYVNRPSLNAAITETINGGAGNDRFVVNEWAKYANPTASGGTHIADRLIGGAGDDILLLNDHQNFYSTNQQYFNQNSSGIDTIVFADADFDDDGIHYETQLFASLEGGDSGTFDIFGQSDHNTLTLKLGERDAQIGIESMAGGESLILDNSGNAVSLIGNPNGAMVSLLGSTTLTTNNSAWIIKAEGGTQNITSGTGSDIVGVFGGTGHMIDSGAGLDDIYVDNSNNVTVDAGAGNDRIELENVTGASLSGGAGNDEFEIDNSTNVTILGGDGDNFYELDGDNTSASITGGTGIDTFNIEGGGNYTLDGGNGGGPGNHFDIHHFSGVANIEVQTNNTIDSFDINHLQSGGAVNINNSHAAKVTLESFDALIEDDTFNDYGSNDLHISHLFGDGDVVLKDFFNGNNQYNLNTIYHSPYHLTRGPEGDRYMRDLALDDYQNYGHGVLDFSGVTMGDFANESTLNIGGTVFTFYTGVGTSSGQAIYFGDASTDDIDGIFTHIVTELNANPAFQSANYLGNGVLSVMNNQSHVDMWFTPDNIANAPNPATLQFSPTSYVQQGSDGSPVAAANPVHWGSVYDDNMETSNINVKIHGRDGHDRLVATANNSQLYGDAGNDKLVIANTTASNATLDGGAGFDTLDLSVFTENLTIDMGATSETVSGMNHTVKSNTFEHIITGSGDDSIAGKFGSYYNIMEGGAGNDVITGGDSGAINTISYQNAFNNTDNIGVTVDLSANTMAAGSTDAGTDTFTNIQNVIGSAYNDTLTGNTQNNVLYGGAGADAIDGGTGNNTLIGGAGNDLIQLGSNSARDTVVMDHDAWSDTGSYDTISGFDNGLLASADAIDISHIKHEIGAHEHDFFDLIDQGILKLSDNGGDAQVSINNFMIAEFAGTSHTSLKWNHFITSENSNVSTNNGTAGNDVIFAGPTTHYGYDGDDTFQINSPSATVYGDMGEDTFVLNNAGQLNAPTLSINGGSTASVDGDFDTLVLDHLSIDFDGAGAGIDITTNFSGIEILDLFGSNITNFGIDDVMNLTDGTDVFSLVINDSTFQATGTTINNLNFAAGDGWQNLGNTDAWMEGNTLNLDLPDIHETEYTTYKATDGTNDVYVHVNNEISASGAT